MIAHQEVSYANFEIEKSKKRVNLTQFPPVTPMNLKKFCEQNKKSGVYFLPLFEPSFAAEVLGKMFLQILISDFISRKNFLGER